jgi:hypothetical protein
MRCRHYILDTGMCPAAEFHLAEHPPKGNSGSSESEERVDEAHDAGDQAIGRIDSSPSFQRNRRDMLMRIPHVGAASLAVGNISGKHNFN